jgi:thymidylate synthase (FAD)
MNYKDITYNVLDHGFIRVVDTMGDDNAIVQAARVSYGQGTKTKQDDESLINYLMRHYHSTPFEMNEIKFHIKLPIFVARQWIRHRTANVNEYSGRYSIMDNEFYVPENIGIQSTSNKQGREEFSDDIKKVDFQLSVQKLSEMAYERYENSIEDGIARELARIQLPVNYYTQWYWKIDLHNLFHFLRLRADEHAQYEIREYAKVICNIVKEWCPIAYRAFEKYRLNSVSFSEPELQILSQKLRLLDKLVKNQPDYLFNGSKGEEKEFNTKLDKLVK